MNHSPVVKKELQLKKYQSIASKLLFRTIQCENAFRWIIMGEIMIAFIYFAIIEWFSSVMFYLFLGLMILSWCVGWIGNKIHNYSVVKSIQIMVKSPNASYEVNLLNNTKYSVAFVILVIGYFVGVEIFWAFSLPILIYGFGILFRNACYILGLRIQANLSEVHQKISNPKKVNHDPYGFFDLLQN